MKKVLLIDGNNIAHKAYHSYSNLTYGGENVGLMFGFISMVRATVHIHKPDKVIICWDHKRHHVRMAIHEEYKAQRKKNSLTDYDDLHRQKDIAMEMAHDLGITQIHGNGMEGDDYIHWVCRLHRKKYQVIIWSSDKDFNQELKHKNVSIWKNDKRLRIYGKNMHKYYPYTPEETVDYLSLAGDTSDNLPGYRGMGPAKVRKFLDEFKTIKNFLSDKDNSFPGIKRDILLDVYRKHRIMIDLDYFYKEYIRGIHEIVFYKGEKKPKFNKRKFNDACRKYNFVRLIDSNFVQPFNK